MLARLAMAPNLMCRHALEVQTQQQSRSIRQSLTVQRPPLFMPELQTTEREIGQLKGRAIHLARHASKSSTLRGTLTTKPCLCIRLLRKFNAAHSTVHYNGISMPWAAVYLGAYLTAPSRAHILVGVPPARSAGHCVICVREERPSIRSRPCWQAWIDYNPRSSIRSSASVKSLTDGFPLVR